ncbi:MAG: hypothetical protein ACKVQU_32910 [Burkholderiales bacterium]
MSAVDWSARSLASSSKFKTFAIVFGIATAVLYVICDTARLPLFTYHPGTDRVDFGWAPARKDEGPAMYWYGWIATSVLGAAILGLLATMLPDRVTSKIPLSLVWIVPVALTPVLIYSLNFFWRW